jgi:Sigma-70, region 4
VDLPEREIATAMGVSAGTVKSHVSRGMAELTRALTMLAADPPLSAVVRVRVPGIEKKVHGQAEQVTSYFWLVHGEVGFWSPAWGGIISQRVAADPPAIGGLTQPFGSEGGGISSPMAALGYAHADVARVVLRAGGRQLASAATSSARSGSAGCTDPGPGHRPRNLRRVQAA